MIFSPEVFRKKMSERQFKDNCIRVRELRETLRELWPPVTPEASAFIHDAQQDLQQIHLFSIFMLDICGGNATVALDIPSPKGPLETA